MRELYAETKARRLDLEKWLMTFSRRQVSWCAWDGLEDLNGVLVANGVSPEADLFEHNVAAGLPYLPARLEQMGI